MGHGRRMTVIRKTEKNKNKIKREDKDIREAITGKEEEETRKNRRVETTA